jgi:hypothetical protein
MASHYLSPEHFIQVRAKAGATSEIGAIFDLIIINGIDR